MSTVIVEGKVYHKYRGELYPDYLHHGNAASFIQDFALKWCVGKGLDIGADRWPLPGSIAVQNEPGRNATTLGMYEDSSLDFVFSSHCLEHLENWQEALQLWIHKIKPGGILFLYLPHESMRLWNPGGAWVDTGHKWKPTLEILLPFLRERSIDIIEYNPDKDAYWSFHVVGRKMNARTA